MENLIVLHTDFGVKDPYQGIMKGVIRLIGSNAEIIDLTHGTPSFDILAGAYILFNSYKFFPEGTIFVSVIDPGVGSSRLSLIIKACNRYFIVPDNGLVYPVVKECLTHNRVEFIKTIDPQKIILNLRKMGIKDWKISSTFHGRDLFAPAAALLTLGVEVHSIAPQKIDIENIKKIDIFHVKQESNNLCLKPVYVDKFGNIALSMLFKNFIKIIGRRNITMKFNNTTKTIRIVSTFSDSNKGELILYENSFGFVEIGKNLGSAFETIGENKTICFSIEHM